MSILVAESQVEKFLAALKAEYYAGVENVDSAIFVSKPSGGAMVWSL